MGIIAGQPLYKGDIGKFRKAVAQAGLNLSPVWDPFYNDNSKDNTRRRLKMGRATHIFNAPQTQQQELERLLKEAFGDRWITAYFIKQGSWMGVSSGKSLCIRLKV